MEEIKGPSPAAQWPHILFPQQHPRSVTPFVAGNNAKYRGYNGENIGGVESGGVPEQVEEGERDDGGIEGEEGPDDGDAEFVVAD